jgi:hypothetical protein
MNEYRYVILGDDGRSWLLEGDECYDKSTDHNHVLPRLLSDGWEPAREMRLGNTVLILLSQFEMEEIPDSDSSDIPF